MSGYEVTLWGSWSRTETFPNDITMMRRLSSQVRREALITGFPQPVQFELRAFQKPASGVALEDQPMREGTFKATVRVEDTFLGCRRAYAVSRAKMMLRWFLADATCRMPTLTFEDSYVRRFM